MQKFEHYTLHRDEGVSDKYIFYSAIDDRSQKSVLIKILISPENDQEATARLRHEYHLLKQFSLTTHFCPKPIELLEDKTKIGVVFEHEPLKDLFTLYPKTAVSLDIFLPLAISITRALTEIHQAGIIHKNLCLKNMLYHQTQHYIQITDFTIATELKYSMIPNLPPRLLQGTLQYMSPEQTGRMNRPLTPQSDLYSLGIVFYELLTGDVPFDNQRPANIIIAHIATQPNSVKDHHSEIPEVLSGIIGKLLSKLAEDRYQTAQGLLLDLERVWTEFHNGKNVTLFPLDTKSVKNKLEFSSKIYGREKDLPLLFKILKELHLKKSSSVLCIQGHSGVGKTRFVQEISRELAINHGFLASGKFDKFQKSDAYDGLRNALDKLVQYQINLPEEEYQLFKEDVLREVGALLAVLTDFIPRMNEILGTQPPLPKVGIEQTRNRFRLALHRFIKVIGLHYPVVLFLDDLQWASPSTLTLLSELILSQDIKNILFVINYRNDEVDDPDSISHFIQRIKLSENFNSITLEGFCEENLKEMLAQMLLVSEETIEEPAKFLMRKTQGNPFFSLLLIEELYSNGILCFSEKHQSWKWNPSNLGYLDEIKTLSDLAEHRIEKLSSEPKKLLHLASCIGNHFTLGELAFASKINPHQLIEEFASSIKAQLIIPMNPYAEWYRELPEKTLLTYEYQFQHDKIQHACYHLIDAEKTRFTHLKVARNWLLSYGPELHHIRLLAIADQFDKGLLHVSSAEEKIKIGHLNYQASQIAIDSVAYDTAYYYDSISKSLLPNDSWENDYYFSFNVYLSYIKSSFLSLHYNFSKKASDEAIQKVKSTLDKVKIFELKANLGRSSAQNHNAIETFEEALALLNGSEIGHRPSHFEVIQAALRFKYLLSRNANAINKSVNSIENLPEETSDENNLMYTLAVHLAEECYYAGDMERYAYVFSTWGIHSFKSHNKELRAACYVMASMVWPRSSLAKRFYSVSVKILEKSKNHEQAALFYCAGTLLHLTWHKPWSEISEDLAHSIELSARSGNLEFLAFSSIFSTYFPPSLSCEAIVSRYTKIKNLMMDISPRTSVFLRIYNQFYRQLHGDTPASCWKDDWIDEGEIIAFCDAKNYPIGKVSLSIFRVRSTIYLNDNSDLILKRNNLLNSMELLLRGEYAYNILLGEFYLFLLEIRLYPTLSLQEKIKTFFHLLHLLFRAQRRVKLCPKNFLAPAIFMSAEYAGFCGRFKKSLKLYDEAIVSAKMNETPEYQGLANECAARLCLKKNKPDLAQAYLKAALEVYANWQAWGKIKQLREEFPQWIKE